MRVIIRRRLPGIVLLLAVLLPGWGAPASSFAADSSAFAWQIDRADTAVIAGWACYTPNTNAALSIHFYKEGPAGFIGEATANRRGTLEDSASCGSKDAFHAFTFAIPPTMMDGMPHTITPYAIYVAPDKTTMIQPLAPQSLCFPVRSATILFSQPHCAPFVPNTVVDSQDGQPSFNVFHMRMGNMALRGATNAVGWDIGLKTGFRPTPDSDRSLYQRSPVAQGTAVQVQGNIAGVWIDSESVPHTSPYIPVGFGYWWSADTRPFVWETALRELTFSFDMKVPTATRANHAEVMAIPYLYFRDTHTHPVTNSVTKEVTNVEGGAFWLGAQTFDPRGIKPTGVLSPEWSTIDSQTQSPLLNSSLANGTTWLHKTSDSAGFQTDRSLDFQHFGFTVTLSEFQTALNRVHALSPTYSLNPTDYALEHINLNPEVYDDDDHNPGSQGTLGLAFKNLQVSMTPPLYDKIYITSAVKADPTHLVYTPPQMQVFFKTAAAQDYDVQRSAVATLASVDGGYATYVVDMRPKKDTWRGTITALRIDPIDLNQQRTPNDGFGIDSIAVGDAQGNYGLMWDFKSAPPPNAGQYWPVTTSSIQGWQFHGINSAWTDGERWGSSYTNGDPYITITTSFATGR